MSQGVQNGERVVLRKLHDKGRPRTYEALGMREGLKEQWEEIMGRDRGLVVFSALPGGGLTTLIDASLEETDRLMRDFVAIEEVNHREHEVQNIAVHTYDAAAGQTPASIIPTLVRLYPNVYIARDLVDAESATLLMNEIADDRFVVTSIPARDAAEALLRLLQMKLPQKQFASVVTAVLYQRLVRKLCPDCKVGYTPPADVLKKLGIPAGKVQQFFRPPKPEEIEKPCETCRGIGYIDRTGIFELLVVTDQMREILAKQPSLDLLRKAARADGQRSLQEEGILLVAKGITSLPELMRVLK
jgi:type II secretory ATPase GspE/PulE/Tfp pilus assembly ATPase PilB-like protein